MAVGEDKLPALLPVPGVRLATVSAGIKTPGRKDLVLMELAAGSRCAGVFTRNAFCAAPVTVAREHLAQSAGQPAYLLTNTGNANAGTGEQGLADARACCEAVAAAAGADASQVLPFSTGVIGEPLPVALIGAAVPQAVAALAADGWAEAAAGIMTTDTRPKGASVQFSCEGRDYVVTGIAKGAGMIRPNMATMLGYLATDAAVGAELLQGMLRRAVDMSFNRITIDGDTSTNDACVLVATGAAGNSEPGSADEPLCRALADAVEEVCVTLAQGLVRDGEGASKFVTVEVNGGAAESECLDVAFTIAHSPLVKTALFASDPNWGRLLAAIGRAGVADLDVNRVGVYLNEVLIAEQGCRAASYTEEQGVAAMAPEEIVIRIELNRGDATARVWTSDFSYDYVRINAEYRT
ncbi:bifunctional glutamate N-acetyltransferase/amino-acid acetyltransferase ArgJ [Seongchinamella sediminis]|uniref:Arginine biosynthesis bifunctional protein ArgJ n=1 Tax=Seongchinamella sediminis TaxID=2283635 RepID=A0A3L7E1L6_9GAMM|nr:bifunctional glutamate N-acetyltransferase/amino-acid acetyltransferase ArgJ [Seongchinamella sediminis]RLQ23738.1 bifunctional glutamate N-acetyltransferase/amino-acid acetyltransferase ArgJ [Seongchinamella sediminis]